MVAYHVDALISGIDQSRRETLASLVERIRYYQDYLAEALAQSEDGAKILAKELRAEADRLEHGAHGPRLTSLWAFEFVQNFKRLYKLPDENDLQRYERTVAQAQQDLKGIPKMYEDLEAVLFSIKGGGEDTVAHTFLRQSGFQLKDINHLMACASRAGQEAAE